MDYKSKKVKGKVKPMNPKIKIHETMKKDIHYEIKTHSEDVESHIPGSKKGLLSSMFMLTISPTGGLLKEEIDILVEFILSANWIMYYAIGIEVITRPEPEDDWKHMHISLVTNIKTDVRGIKDLFYGLINEEERMVSIPNDKNDKGIVENVSFKIDSCRSKYFDTKTPMAQCAYTLKSAAAGQIRDSIAENDYNNRLTCWTNLFDDEKECTDECELQQWRLNRITFAHLLIEEEKKKKNKAPFLIATKYAIGMAQSYAILNGMEWTEDTHIDIIATMVTDKGREKTYELAPNFLVNCIKIDLHKKKNSSNYKEFLVDALKLNDQLNDAKLAKVKAKLAKAAGTIPRRSKADDALIKSLKRELTKQKKLKESAIHWCKKHLTTIDNFKNVHKQIAYRTREIKRLCSEQHHMTYEDFDAFKKSPQQVEIQEHRDALAKVREQQRRLMRIDMHMNIDKIDANVDALISVDANKIPVPSKKRSLDTITSEQEQNKRFKAENYNDGYDAENDY
jgi:hypothetical protein